MHNIKGIFDILLVEDNPGDILLTRKALEDSGVNARIGIARDGEEAMRYLRKERGFEEAATPDLVLLDLNLPRLDGREVLEEIKSDPFLRRIPVVILTSSEAPCDIVTTYERYANCYVVKPVGSDKFLEVVRTINHFWLDTARLPMHDGAVIPGNVQTTQ